MQSNFLIFLTAFSAVLAFSCSKEMDNCEQNVATPSSEPDASAKKRIEDVITFINERGRDIPVKSADSFQIEPILEGVDTVMYLVHYSNGWELISGDQRTDPVLVYCNSGDINKEDLFSNPAQRDVVSGTAQYLKELSNNVDSKVPNDRANVNPPHSFVDENGRYWVYAGRYLVSSTHQTQSPLIGTKWGQGSKDYVSFPEQQWNICSPYDSPSYSTSSITVCGIRW